MGIGKAPQILRRFFCILLAVTLAGCSTVYAEELPPADADSEAAASAALWQGMIIDYRDWDILSLLNLTSYGPWDTKTDFRSIRFFNAAGDILVQHKGRVYYDNGRTSEDVDKLFSQLTSDLRCANNDQFFRSELFNLSAVRGKGIPPASIQDGWLRRNCYHAVDLLKKLAPRQEPCLLNMFEKSVQGKDYAAFVFGFLIDGTPVYGLNENLLGIINPDELETALQEIAILIYDRNGLCNLEISDILGLEPGRERQIISRNEAENILAGRLAAHPEISYTVHQCWMSYVPLGNHSREPLTVTPFWSFFLTWKKDGETWCATPRINALTGDILWY